MNRIPCTIQFVFNGGTFERETYIEVTTGTCAVPVVIELSEVNAEFKLSRPAARELTRQLSQTIASKP